MRTRTCLSYGALRQMCGMVVAVAGGSFLAQKRGEAMNNLVMVSKTMFSSTTRSACRWLLLTGILGCSACSDPVHPNPDAGGGTEGGADADPSIQRGTRIRIDSGEIQGEVDGATRRFRGIPFAAPPIGALRWKPPQPVKPWDGVRTTTSYSGKCPQNGNLLGPASAEEDCLYLNVWTPEPAPQRRLPVMIWLHGGSNISGSASDEIPLGIGGYIFDGRHIAENQQVVVVTTNYRLGVLGFFSHPALDAEDARGVSGNQGLLDQRMAFDWVRRNIAAFGGDPDKVTIFGESAGSIDICFHMMSQVSRGLFHRAISQSGGCTRYARTRSTAEAEMSKFGAAVGCTDAAGVLDCLRALPVTTLLVPAPVDGGQPKAAGGIPYQGGTPQWDFTVTVDGDVLSAQPRAIVDSGDFAKVPYLIGSNTDEGTIFHVFEPEVMTEEEYRAALRRRFGDDADAIAAHYPVSDFPRPQEALMRVTGDTSLVCATYDTARRVAAGGVPVYLYNFDRPIPISALAGFNLRATHGAEIAYIFETAPPDLPEPDVALGRMMQGYWARHAIAGDPNGGSAPAWPAWKRDADVRLNFNLEPIVVTDFRRELCDFWATLYDKEFK
jgi:para-nitrobenzyl esterase